MKSRVVKCSVFLAGHHTSVSLEDEFWHGLKGIAAGRHLQLNEVIHEIGTKRQTATILSTRLFVLEHYRSQGRSLTSRGARLDRPDGLCDPSVEMIF